MLKKNNGGGGGKTPRPDEGDERGARRARFDRRKANGGKDGAEVMPEAELAQKLEQPEAVEGSFEERLAAKRAALGLPPLDLSSISPEPELIVSEEVPVESESILPVAIPSFDDILAEIEVKGANTVVEKKKDLFLELSSEYNLSGDSKSLLEKFLEDQKSISEKMEKRLRLLLKTLRNYLDRTVGGIKTVEEEYDFFNHMLNFLLDKGEENFSELELSLKMALLLSDLSLFPEARQYLVDKKKLEAARRATQVQETPEVQPATEISEVQETPEVQPAQEVQEEPATSLPLTPEKEPDLILTLPSVDDLLAQAEVSMTETSPIAPDVEVAVLPEAPKSPENKIEFGEGVFEERVENFLAEDDDRTPVLVETADRLEQIPANLKKDYFIYLNQVKDLKSEILKLEDANREINAWSDQQDENWHNNDEKLSEYGRMCREYTLNIQKLRDLDAKLSRAQVLYNDIDNKVKILQSSRDLGLPLEELAVEYDKQTEAVFENRQQIKLVLPNKEIKRIDLDISDEKTFANISFDDKELEEDLDRYVREQRSSIKGLKDISGDDNYAIDTVLRLDYLSQYLDLHSLQSESGDQSLGKKLDQKYFEIHKLIVEKYGILLPTRKAGIPLYFDGKQARISAEYLKKLYDYNRENNPSVRAMLDSGKMSELQGIAWVEATLYSQIMMDSTITLGQLTAIKTRLNAILLTHAELKKNWLPLKDPQVVQAQYPYLKYYGGWFKDLSEDELKERLGKRIAEGNMRGGIFEYSLKEQPKEDKELTETAPEQVESISDLFISKYKEAVMAMDGFDEAYKAHYCKILDTQIAKLLEPAENKVDLIRILQVERNKYSGVQQDSHDFYDGLVNFAFENLET